MQRRIIDIIYRYQDPTKLRSWIAAGLEVGILILLIILATR